MPEHRRRVSVLAAAAASIALLVTPLATVAQDSVSEECTAPNLEGSLKTAGRLTLSTDNPAFFPW